MRNAQLGFHEMLAPPPTATAAEAAYMTARHGADKKNYRKRARRLEMSEDDRAALKSQRQALDAERYRRDREKIIARQKRYYRKNRTRILRQANVWRRKNQVSTLLYQAAQRAAKFELEFNLEFCDIEIPEFCPVLGIPLIMGSRKALDTSPSLDRIDNRKGYIKGNVRVISHRANRLKNDATIEEVEAVLAYMRGQR